MDLKLYVIRTEALNNCMKYYLHFRRAQNFVSPFWWRKISVLPKRRRISNKLRRFMPKNDSHVHCSKNL